MAVSIEICQLWSHPHHHYPDKQDLTRLNQRNLNSRAKAWLWTALQKYSEANKSLYSTRHPESKMSNIKVKVSWAFVRLILRKTRSLYFLFAFSDPCGKNTRRAAGRRDILYVTWQENRSPSGCGGSGHVNGCVEETGVVAFMIIENSNSVNLIRYSCTAWEPSSRTSYFQRKRMS